MGSGCRSQGPPTIAEPTHSLVTALIWVPDVVVHNLSVYWFLNQALIIHLWCRVGCVLVSKSTLMVCIGF